MANTATISFSMPTPLGHAVAGLTVGWLSESAVPPRDRLRAIPIACAAVAMMPDLDILVDSHRTYAHSIAAVAVIGFVAWAILRARTPYAARFALAIAAAYGSHLLLDWLGRDSSQPPGLMALWPVSSQFYISGIDLFGEVSRRYWKFDEFIVGNLKALAWELVVLSPIVALSWWLRRAKNLKSEI
jgi:membrane-bound metal-dependent hydrolase YbcI (DUF457 family)